MIFYLWHWHGTSAVPFACLFEQLHWCHFPSVARFSCHTKLHFWDKLNITFYNFLFVSNKNTCDVRRSKSFPKFFQPELTFAPLRALSMTPRAQGWSTTSHSTLQSWTFLLSSFATVGFRQVLYLKSITLSSLPFSLLQCLCTQWVQWLQKMAFEVTPLQHTPHGCFPEVKIWLQYMSLIITLVIARFTHSSLLSMQFFHANIPDFFQPLSDNI